MLQSRHGTAQHVVRAVVAPCGVTKTMDVQTVWPLCPACMLGPHSGCASWHVALPGREEPLLRLGDGLGVGVGLGTGVGLGDGLGEGDFLLPPLGVLGVFGAFALGGLGFLPSKSRRRPAMSSTVSPADRTCTGEAMVHPKHDTLSFVGLLMLVAR